MDAIDALKELNDDALAQLTREGNKDAFGELWLRYQKGALAVARAQRCSSPEDVVSDAFRRVLTLLKQGKGPATNFSGYLYSTVRNIAQDLRKAKSAVAMDTDEVMAMAREQTEDTALAEIEKVRIEEVFAKMPERDVTLLRMVLRDSLPVGEAAAAVGVTRNHASVLIKRARLEFQRLWVQNHVGEITAEGECRWVLDHAGAYLTDAMSGRTKQRLEKHVAECESCRDILGEVKVTSRMWGKALAGTGIGMLPGGFAQTAWGAEGGTPWPFILGAAATAAAVATGLLLWPWGGSDETPAPPPIVVAAPAQPTPSTFTPPSETSSPEETSSPAPTTAAPGQPTARHPGGQPVTSPAAPTAPARPAIVAGADAGRSGLCYPVLLGTAEPGAALSVSGLGWGVAVIVDADGHWFTSPLTMLPPGTVTYNVAYQGDSAGSVAASVHVSAPPTVSVTRHGDGVLLVLTGQPGAAVEVLLDGAPAGTVSLDAAGQARPDYALTPGAHTVTVRYAPPGCTGPANSTTIAA